MDGNRAYPAEMLTQRRRRIQQFVLDIFYPNRCPCCGQWIDWDAYLCEMCKREMETPEDRFCPRCGKTDADCLCGTGLAYDRAVVLTSYHLARPGILSLKTAESLNFAYACGGLLAERILAQEELMDYDLLVPVPMAKSKRRKRGINPAEQIAREISRLTNIPLDIGLLRDTGRGKTQHTLSAADRARNTGRFSIGDADLTGYRILLCDDVLTTGSTMHQCASLLKKRGAAAVAAVAAASTERKGQSA